jgi:hypothetical protein
MDALTTSPRQTLAGFVGAAEGDQGISIDEIETGATVVVRTFHSTYHLVVFSRTERTVLASGGAFPEETPVVLQGATTGGNLVRTGWIGVGLRLELTDGERRVITSRVRSIDIIHNS